MSTPEQPATPALTRKQLRDIRNTGATPIVSGDVPTADPTPPADAAPDVPEDVEESVEAPAAPEEHPPHAAAPLPRAAVPAVVHDLPGADASVDLGVSPLTRRQARQQERIRTASVPVITPEVAAAHAASVADREAENSSQEQVDQAPSGEVSLAQLFGTDAAAPVAEDDAPVDAVIEGTVVEGTVVEGTVVEDEHGVDQHATDEADHESEDVPTEAERDAPADHGAEADAEEAERAVVSPQFGAELLAGDVGQVKLPASFDQLISRSVTGAIGTGNALILSQTPSAPPLVAPVASTGEVLITGTFNLPEGLGSTGHAPGTADGKEVDAVLVDGELPAHSSPTPIAASAAISTVKNGGDIIKPPTPEKGGRLMLTLAITAGVLALALVGVLILAFVTGVF
jgi:hypothetical protein